MPIHDLVRVYQSKGDEELLQLAAAPEHLTSDARLALQSELSRRRIGIAGNSDASQNEGYRHDTVLVTASERLTGEPRGIGAFIAEVLRTYHTNFQLFFKITAPAVIISTIAIITGRNAGREIARQLPRGVEVLAHRTQILEIWLANGSAYFVSWMAFSFSFAAICIAVEETAVGFAPSAGHSLLSVRERLSPFLQLSLLLFVLMLVAVAASELLATGVFCIPSLEGTLVAPFDLGR